MYICTMVNGTRIMKVRVDGIMTRSSILSNGMDPLPMHKMKINDEDVNLALRLGSTNFDIHAKLSDTSGAGVNAESRMDMAFAASDPLSELVWSPHNGLSLKCADSSVANKRPFILWNVGPSENGISSPPSFKSNRCMDEKALDQGKLSISEAIVGSGIIGDQGNSIIPSRSFPLTDLGANPGLNDGKSGIIMEEEDVREEPDHKEEGCCEYVKQNLFHGGIDQIADVPKCSKRNAELNTFADGTNEVDIAKKGYFSTIFARESHDNQNSDFKNDSGSNENLGLDINHSEPLGEKLSGSCLVVLPNLPTQKETADKVTEVTEYQRSMPCIPAHPLKRLESSAENDLFRSAAKEAVGLFRSKLQNRHSLAERSPTSNIIPSYQEKGKEKALSDEDAYVMESNDDDDSHESAESCNSTGLFSKGIKRRGYDHELLVDRKRMRRLVCGYSGTSSIVGRPSSSFRNWIFNMVKGLSDPNRRDSSSVALNPACSYDVYGKNHQKNIMSKRRSNMGFQAMFQSLYCRNANALNARMQMKDEPMDEVKQDMMSDSLDVKSIPQLCDENKDNPGKQIVLSGVEINPSIAVALSKPLGSSSNIGLSTHAFESCSGENKSSKVLAFNRERNEVIPPDSSSEQVNISVEKTMPNIPLTMNDVSDKSNPLTSSWITRFSSRIPVLEKSNEIAEEVNAYFSPCQNVRLEGVVNDVSPIAQRHSEAEDDSSKCEAYSSEKGIQKVPPAEAPADLKTTSKNLPILPCQKFRSPEAMTSVFARRLDALRHIAPSKGSTLSTCSLKCFFCGGGHILRKCPEITVTELENLLGRMSSLKKVQESPRFCIRCFQSDHWAVSCPSEPSSRRRLGSEQNDSVTSKYTAPLIPNPAGNEKYSSEHGGMDCCSLTVADPPACSNGALFWASFARFQTFKAKKLSSKRASSSDEHARRLKFPFSHVGTSQDTVAPLEIFHAIRNLRLSRVDILRCLNSSSSVSHLSGYFLRLRLGKVEAGVGGNGYYVASITGMLLKSHGIDGHLTEDGYVPAKSILVDVAGTKSSIESQYISNHDFLEDEVNSWWCRMVERRCRIPTLNELNSKFNERKRLGL